MDELMKKEEMKKHRFSWYQRWSIISAGGFMKTKRTLLFLPAMIIIFLLSLQVNLVFALSTTEPNVVYVKDGGTGDGGTAATAVGTLEEAYATLIANTDIENDASVNGIIVICGRIKRSDNFNLDNDDFCSHKGSVTLTSVYGNIDYRESGAELHLASQDTTKTGTACEQRFQVGGPTVMKNLNINRADSKQPLTIYAGTDLHIAETVHTLDTNFTYSAPVDAILGLTDEQIDTIELSGHRGYQPMGPENSVLSFQAAADLGFDYIETDIYRTTDGELVCIHDSTIDRTYNGSGKVTEMSLAELRQYRIDVASYGYDISQASLEKLYIPTFREYLEICKKGGCKPFIELKDDRDEVTAQIIDMALEYFNPEDIVISCSKLSMLEVAHQYEKDLFIHLIWGDTSDAGYTNSINVLSQMKNSAGQIYAGIAFNIKDLHISENYNKAKSWIGKANAAGLQTCLRGADDMTQLRMMYDLGIDYYPTNTTSPEMLQQLKITTPGTPADYSENSQSTKGINDHRMFIRGGFNSGTTTEDVSITLLSGQYDFVAPSNGEQATTGNYSVTVGRNAFVSRLIGGETGGNVSADRASAAVIVQDEAIVTTLYMAGDKYNVSRLTVTINGGWVKRMASTRSAGKVGNLTVNVKDISLLPAELSLDSSVITGTKTLTLSGTESLGDSTIWDKLVARDGAVITLTGTYPDALEREGNGKFLVNDQSFTFGTVEIIEADGGAVTLESDIPYTLDGSGSLAVTWYADNNGVRGATLSDAPKVAGTYWVGVAVAEAATNNKALYHAAVAEQYIRFTVVQAETGRRPLSGGGVTRYTIKFDTNGGSFVTNKTVTRNGTLEEPTTPTKDGYTFDGWYTDKDFTIAYDFDTKVTKAITLYAKWTENKTYNTDNNEDKTDETDKMDKNVWENPFTDVDTDDWYYTDVRYAVKNKLFNGITETKFEPDGLITRAMMVTVLYRAEDKPEIIGTTTFEDIDENDYYAKAVFWGQQNEIIKGYSETELRPDENITREQIAAIIHRYAVYKGYDISAGENTNILSYEDFDSISKWAVADVQYAIGSGLMKGKKETTINPQGNATRAEIAAILQRFIEANK